MDLAGSERLGKSGVSAGKRRFLLSKTQPVSDTVLVHVGPPFVGIHECSPELGAVGSAGSTLWSWRDRINKGETAATQRQVLPDRIFVNIK